MTAISIEPESVLEFWFCERARALWFEKDPAFDDEIRARFGAAIAAAQAGAFEDWCDDPRCALALLILLDQMARNIHRGTALAFAGDARALGIAERAIAAGFDRLFEFPQRRLFYLPHEHSEDPAVQDRGLALFAALAADAAPEHRGEAEDQLDYARRHAEIVARFGRYPHRNAALGRACTPDEESFLATWDNAF